MSGSVNRVILIGNLGRDPEVRSTQDGREIANMTIATSESWKDKTSGERKEKTEWHRVSVFNENLVKVVKNYLKKGAKVYIEGQLQTRKWSDKDGVEKYSTEIVLQGFNGTLTMLDSKKSDDQPHSNPAVAAVQKEFPGATEIIDDEIPFAYLIACALSGAAVLMQYTMGTSFIA